MRSRSPFVGRYRELMLLREGLKEFARGTPMIASISGEAGIGKTTLISRAMDSAPELGIRVVRSTAVEGGGSPAYWLWKNLLRQLSPDDKIAFDDLALFEHAEPEKTVPGGTASEQIAIGLTDATTRPQREFQLHEDVIDHLRAHARKTPLLIVFEDLHWADDESLRLLSHFVRGRERGPGLNGIEVGVAIGLVMTHRDRSPDRSTDGPDSFSDAILQVARAAGSVSIRLGPFTESESKEVIKLIAGDTEHFVNDETGDVFERTGGNPLFITEIARMAVPGGTVSTVDGVSGELPATVQLAIDSRLGALSPPAIELLEMASLARGAVTPAVLLDVAKNWTLEEVHSALGEATDNGFLAEVHGHTLATNVRRPSEISTDSLEQAMAGTWNFRHAIVREAVASRISINRRVRLHAAYVNALETEHRNALPAHSEALLFHALKARPLIENSRVVRYLLFAAREAMRSLAFERAADHFLGVIELSGAEEIDGSLAEAMYGFSLAASGSGRDQQIADYFRQSFRYYVSVGLIDLALDVAQIKFIDTLGMSQAIDVYDAAIELVEPDSRAEANILGNLAKSVGVTRGDYTRAKELLHRSIAISRSLGDVNLEMQLCGNGIHIAAFGNEFAASRDYCKQVVKLAEETSDPLSESSAFLHLGLYSFSSGETKQAFNYLLLSLQRANDSHVSERISSSHKVLASTYIRVCDWQSADRSIRSALEHYPTDVRVLGLKVTACAMTGDADCFEAALDEFFQTTKLARDIGEGASTRFLQMAYRARRSERLSQEIQRSIGVIETNSRTTEMMGTAVAFGMACLALEGGRDDFLLIRERLMKQGLPVSDLNYLPGITSLAGLVEEAEDEFERMISFASDKGHVFNEVWLRYDYAAHLVRHAKGETAIALAVAQGRRSAEKAGIITLAARYDQLELTNVSRKGKRAGLTRRELEVLRLIHSGMSNHDIAEQLVLSRHTIVRHISNIFAKLDVSNRTEASKTAVELGLV